MAQAERKMSGVISVEPREKKPSETIDDRIINEEIARESWEQESCKRKPKINEKGEFVGWEYI